MKKDILKAIKNSFRSKFQKFKSKFKANNLLENMHSIQKYKMQGNQLNKVIQKSHQHRQISQNFLKL